jgi:hypothetical protein
MSITKQQLTEQSGHNRRGFAKVLMYALSAEVPPNPKHRGYPESRRKRAAEMYVDIPNRFSQGAIHI